MSLKSRTLALHLSLLMLLSLGACETPEFEDKDLSTDELEESNLTASKSNSFAATPAQSATGSHYSSDTLPVTWFERGGPGADIGVSNDNPPNAFMTHKTACNIYGCVILQHAGGIGTIWHRIGGLANQVTVAPNGQPWVINNEGKIFERVVSRWYERPGNSNQRASDIGIGADGSVFIVGIESGKLGSKIYKWTGSTWQLWSGRAVRIDVGPNGYPWIVDRYNRILEWTGAEWQLRYGSNILQAYDIGVGKIEGEAAVYIVSTEPIEGGNKIYRYDDRRDRWMELVDVPLNRPIGGVRIDIAGQLPWIVQDDGDILMAEIR